MSRSATPGNGQPSHAMRPASSEQLGSNEDHKLEGHLPGS